MSEKKMTSIGGQAIIEGVMMKGPEKIAMAVRKPDGEIIIEKKDLKKKNVFFKIPIIRGVFAFVDSMVTGVDALMFSAKFYDDEGKPIEENKEERIENKEKEDKKENKKKKDKKEKKDDGELTPAMMYGSVCLSVIITILLFIALPNFIAGLVVDKESSVVLYNGIESIVKIAIFVGYLALVSQMKDIQRVFQYHGAEHKSIFCYENGEELTVENVKKYTRFHPRCGTSFLLFVMVVSILVFSVMGRFESRLLNVLIRIALMPVIAGLSYEIIRFAGKNVDNKWVSWLSKPGLWLQRLTTREPDEKQIEVAIASLKAVIPSDSKMDEWGK
ncbi:MAG: DUF1385 domain-containing protein [Clostridia bacterium]|nr:DUF1385 domain-containing protein [Clostridia bacterium]